MMENLKINSQIERWMIKNPHLTSQIKLHGNPQTQDNPFVHPPLPHSAGQHISF